MTTYVSVEVAVSSLRVHEGAEMWLGRKMELVEQRAAIKYPQEKWFTPTRIRNNMSAASGESAVSYHIVKKDCVGNLTVGTRIV